MVYIVVRKGSEALNHPSLLGCHPMVSDPLWISLYSGAFEGNWPTLARRSREERGKKNTMIDPLLTLVLFVLYNNSCSKGFGGVKPPLSLGESSYSQCSPCILVVQSGSKILNHPEHM